MHQWSVFRIYLVFSHILMMKSIFHRFPHPHFAVSTWYLPHATPWDILETWHDSSYCKCFTTTLTQGKTMCLLRSLPSMLSLQRESRQLGGQGEMASFENTQHQGWEIIIYTEICFEISNCRNSQGTVNFPEGQDSNIFKWQLLMLVGWMTPEGYWSLEQSVESSEWN